MADTITDHYRNASAKSSVSKNPSDIETIIQHHTLDRLWILCRIFCIFQLTGIVETNAGAGSRPAPASAPI